MKDLIERQAVIDALNKLDVSDGVGISSIACGLQEEAIRSIENLPSAQPEIIRCRECKHYTFADNRAFGFPVKRCEWTGFEDVDADDFCSRAERREVSK